MSTIGPVIPTGTNKPVMARPPLSPIALIDIDLPDDRPKVSELIKFHESLIKGQLHEMRVATEKIQGINMIIFQ